MVKKIDELKVEVESERVARINWENWYKDTQKYKRSLGEEFKRMDRESSFISWPYRCLY